MSQYANFYTVLLNKIEHHYHHSSWIINRYFILNTVPVCISFCSSINSINLRSGLFQNAVMLTYRSSKIVAILSIHFRMVHSQYEFVFSLKVLSEEVMMKSTVFWYVILYSLVEVHWRFRGMDRLCLQWSVSQARNSKILAASRAACRLLLSGYLHGLVFSPEDRGCMFPWNSGKFLQDYMVLCPRRLFM
jgi:hypothetical protein